MEPMIRNGLVLGAIAGAALGVFFYFQNNNIFDFLLVPFGALMGCGPALLKPKDE